MRRALLLIVLVLGVGLAGCGGGSDRYRVDAIFDNASFLIPGQDVRIAGANVGTVTDVRLTPDHKARISMAIDREFAPFHSDADCFIAPQSLIGERFIQCAPGTVRGRALRGDPPTVPLANTHAPVDPDLVTATFRLPVRERLSIILNELGAGLAGNGEALSAAIRRANPAIQATQDVLRIVNRDRAVLGRLVDRSDGVIAELARRRTRVASFIDEAAKVSTTAARRQGAVSEGIRRLPGTLDETRASLVALRTLAQRSRPLLGELRTAAGPLDRLVGDTPPLANAARPALRHLAAMARTGTGTLRDGAPVVRRLRTFANVALPAGDLVTQLNESLRDRGVVEGIQSFVYDVALSISRFDKDSHILPSYLIGNDCATYATTTNPACDAHLVKGAASARARARRAHRRRHHRAAHQRRAAAPAPERAAQPNEQHRRSPVPGPAGALLDTLGKLTRQPPVPAPATPPPPPDVEHVLDQLLGP